MGDGAGGGLVEDAVGDAVAEEAGEGFFVEAQLGREVMYGDAGVGDVQRELVAARGLEADDVDGLWEWRV